MCVGIPGRIMTTSTGADGVPMAEVDFSGVTKDVCMTCLPDAAPGDYVLVHVGFAISALDPDEAEELLGLFAEIESEVSSD